MYFIISVVLIHVSIHRDHYFWGIAMVLTSSVRSIPKSRSIRCSPKYSCTRSTSFCSSQCLMVPCYKHQWFSSNQFCTTFELRWIFICGYSYLCCGYFTVRLQASVWMYFASICLGEFEYMYVSVCLKCLKLCFWIPECLSLGISCFFSGVGFKYFIQRVKCLNLNMYTYKRYKISKCNNYQLIRVFVDKSLSFF